MLLLAVHGYEELRAGKICSLAYSDQPATNFAELDEDWLALRATFDRIAGALPRRFQGMDGTGVFEDVLRATHAWVERKDGQRLFVPALLGDWWDETIWTPFLRMWLFRTAKGGADTTLVERSGECTRLPYNAWAFDLESDAEPRWAVGTPSRPLVAIDATLYRATLVRLTRSVFGSQHVLGGVPRPVIYVDAEGPLRPLFVNRHGVDQFISAWPSELKGARPKDWQLESLRRQVLREQVEKRTQRLRAGTHRLRMDLLLDYDTWSRTPGHEKRSDVRFAEEFGRKFREKYKVIVDPATSLFDILDLGEPDASPVSSQRFSEWKRTVLKSHPGD